MDGYLKQSTASQTRWIGPFIDDTDFKTAETGLTVANTDIKVSKNGGSSANKNSGGGTHDVNGMYAVTWDATDTATVGELKYSVKVAGALQVFGSYVVLEEAVYDALFGASAAGYQVPIWAAAGSTVNLSATTVATVSTLTGHTAQTGDAYAALTSAVADSIPSDGSRPSVQQAAYMLTQFMLERSVSGTTLTINKPDGTTALMTLTLNDDTSPTAITRAS